MQMGSERRAGAQSGALDLWVYGTERRGHGSVVISNKKASV